MTLKQLVAFVGNKENFTSIQNYIDFALSFLEFVSDDNNIQAEIVARKETKYRFYQFKEDAHFRVTRPFNSELLYSADNVEENTTKFLEYMNQLRERKKGSKEDRERINRAIYTLQQCIGFEPYPICRAPR